jgi:hypothetical protein
MDKWSKSLQIEECATMQTEPIFVIGGSPTIRDFDLMRLRTKTTIALNKTAFHIPQPTYFLTLDYTAIRKIGLERIRDEIKATRVFIANFANPVLQNVNGAITDIKHKLVYQSIYDCFDMVILARRRSGFGVSLGDFCAGNNSGYCGIQLAIALGYTEIYLVGIDMVATDRHIHFHEGYGPNDRDIYNKNAVSFTECFTYGLEMLKREQPSIHIYTCSSQSNIALPYVPFNEIL